MNEKVKVEFSTDEFTGEIKNSFAYVILKGNAFKSISNIMRNQDFLPWFDKIENTKELKGVVVLNEPGSMGESAYTEFLSDLTGERIIPGRRINIEKFKCKEIRAIEINMVSNLIRRISLFTKFFVVAFRDDVVTPFIGVSLAADFRVVSEEIKFSFAHATYGLPPSGALPFFLPKYISQSKAFELSSIGGVLQSKELSDLKLVNKVFPTENFEKNLDEFIESLSVIPTGQIRSSKILYYRYIGQLEEYLNFERQYLV